MPEEKKEEKAQETAQKEAEVKTEAAAGVQAPAQAPSQAPAPAQAAQKAAPVKKERPANCAVCNKSLKNKRWYYRNGKYYCTKRCWKTTLKKKEEAPKEGSEAKK